jgi:hypothetical protein
MGGKCRFKRSSLEDIISSRHFLLLSSLNSSNCTLHFSNVLQEYRDVMRHELSSQNDPLDANLEKVLPSLHEWHRINKDEMMRLKQSVSSIDGNLCDIHSRLDSGFSDIKQSLKSTKVQMKQELAGTFLEIAKHLVRDAGGQLSDSTTLRDIVGPSIMTQDEPVGAFDPAQDTLETSRIAEDPAEVHQLFRLKPKHLNLLELVQEGMGLGTTMIRTVESKEGTRSSGRPGGSSAN